MHKIHHEKHSDNMHEFAGTSGHDYGGKRQLVSSDEIDLFDIVSIVRRQWRWGVGCILACSIAAGVAALMYRSVYEINIALELPTENTYTQFSLPKLTLGVNGSLSVEERFLINQDKILNLIDKKVRSEPFRRNWQSVATLVASDKSKPVMHFESSDPKNILEEPNGFLGFLSSEIRGDMQTTVTEELKDRIEQIERTKVILKKTTLDGIRNKIELKQNELEIKRKSLVDRISALEKESKLRRQNDLQKILEVNAKKRLEIDKKIEALNKLASMKRQDQIAQLQEAANIAEQLGIDGESSRKEMHANGSRNAEGAPLYLRGKKAILAEIAGLKAQTNNSMIIPELRELEIGLDLIEGEVEFEVINSRKNDAVFNAEIPVLRTQLEMLDKDSELESLKKMLANQANIELYISELPLMEDDIARSNRLLESVAKIDPIKYEIFAGSPHLQHKNRKLLIIFAGMILGSFLGILLIMIIEGWQVRKASEYHRVSQQSLGILPEAG